MSVPMVHGSARSLTQLARRVTSWPQGQLRHFLQNLLSHRVVGRISNRTNQHAPYYTMKRTVALISACVLLLFGAGAHAVVCSFSQPGAAVPDAVAASVMGGCPGVFLVFCNPACGQQLMNQSPSAGSSYKGVNPYWCVGNYDCGACYTGHVPCGT